MGAPLSAKKRSRWPRRLARGASCVLLVAVVLYAACTGPRDLGQYPSPATSLYRLPWEPGVTRWCVQGNNAVVSHRGSDEYAYDFAMPVGSAVCAARGGVVLAVEDCRDGNGVKAPNNYIAVRHDDGTIAWYLHLKRGGALAKKAIRSARARLLP